MELTTDYTTYTNESNPEQLEKLKETIFLIEDNIIYFNQVAKPNVFVYHIQFEKIRELIKELDHFYMIIYVENSKRPSAENRTIMKTEFNSLLPKLQYVAVVTGKNYFINTLANFVLKGAGLNSFSTFPDFKSAKYKIDKLKQTQ